MAKYKCKTCGKDSLSEYCWLHKPKKAIKRGELKPKKTDQYKEDYENMDAFFEEIWRERPHYCFETGKWLGNEFDRRRFHHLIHKGPYPQYAYCKWNIVILDADIHERCHQNLDSCPKVKELTEKVRENRIF